MERIDKIRLTVREKILLHLREYLLYRDKKDVPTAITQKGISEFVGIKISHVPRALKKLIEDGFIIERKAYVGRINRKLKTYFLSDEGIRYARVLLETLGDKFILMRNGEFVRRVQLKEIDRYIMRTLPYLKLLRAIEEEDILDIKSLETEQKIVDYTEKSPEIVSFVDREKELEELRDLFETKTCKVITVYGSAGIGKTAIVSKFIESYRKKKSIFWYHIEGDETLKDILIEISEFFSRLGVNTLKSCISTDISVATSVGAIYTSLETLDNIIMIFDNYCEVREEIVDFFSLFVDVLPIIKNEIKVIFTSRGDAPFYVWFYDKRDVDKKIVGELRLKGLDEDSGKLLLGVDDIDENAYKQIHQLTGGVPQLLTYIKEGNVDSLKDIGKFSTQEIRLLMFLKTVTKGGAMG